MSLSGKWMLVSSEMLSSGNGNIARRALPSGGSRFLSRQNISLYRQLGFEGDGLAELSGF